MIVALLALAAAMMIAGITAVVQGFPYVRLESGMAMVYGGAVVGSAGVLLLGVAAVVASLKRVERALRAGVPTPVGQSIPERSEPDHDPLVDEFQLVEAPPIERPRIEPSLSAPSPRETRPEPVEDPLFDLEMTPPAEVKEKEKPKPTAPPMAVRPPIIAAKPVPSPEPDALAALRSSLDPFQEPAPPSKAERTPVGRYSSEGNTYVMFDDGSIEADTPKGRYTFASLDELKAFVDGGGERNTRGAA